MSKLFVVVYRFVSFGPYFLEPKFLGDQGFRELSFLIDQDSWGTEFLGNQISRGSNFSVSKKADLSLPCFFDCIGKACFIKTDTTSY